jgi:HK97 family phage major capsid protein
MEEPTLIEQLNAAHDEIDKILATADTEKRPLTPDEVKACEDLGHKRDELAASVERQKVEANIRRAQGDWHGMLATTGGGRTTTAGDPSNGDLTKPLLSNRHGYGKLHAFKGEKAREDAYKCGQQLLAVCGDGPVRSSASLWCQEHGVQLAVVHNEGSNVHGGYLVQDSMEAAIVDLREQYGVARQEFRVKPMASDVHSFPRRKTGLTVYYPAENGSITESNKTWEQITLTAKKAAVLSRYSTELNEDAIISLADDLASEMAWAFSYAEDQDAFIGDGTSTYGGMTGIVTKINDGNYAGSVYEALSGNTAFSTLDLVDFEAMVGKLPQYASGRAKWYISKVGFWASMARLIDAAGGNTGQMLQGGTGLMFLGSPVVIVQNMNTTVTAQTSTTGLCLYGDLTLCCYLGTRRGVTIQMSDQRYFEYDQIGIKGTERFAVTTSPGDPTTPASVCGPVVSLSTPSA